MTIISQECSLLSFTVLFDQAIYTLENLYNQFCFFDLRNRLRFANETHYLEVSKENSEVKSFFTEEKLRYTYHDTFSYLEQFRNGSAKLTAALVKFFGPR